MAGAGVGWNDDGVMVTSAASATRPSVEWEPRRAFRDSDQAVIAGVCSGLADHLGLPVVWVRVAMAGSVLFSGLGLFFYAGCWMVLPARRHFTDAAPGLAAATRSGKRQGRVRDLLDNGPAVAVGAVAFGVLLLVSQLLGSIWVLWPALTVILGVAVLWWQADQAQRERWLDPEQKITPWRALVGTGGPAASMRLFAGVGLMVLGVMLFSLQSGQIDVALGVGAATLISIAAIGFVLGPLIFRLASDLSEERDERVRTQERSDVAAHLHDSVLQTLALIQKSAADPAMVTRLARAQERDLRSWLYDDTPAGAGTVASLLKQFAAEVEDNTGVPVEIVNVGDRDLGDRGRALCGAAREAMLNAAKHSGAARVDVYAEIADHAAVFVRDRGVGFDPENTAADRHGIRDSIEARMARHGGEATVLSTPGRGTEVRLTVPREETP